MSRKSFLLGLAILVALVGVVGASLALLVSHEPEFYHNLAAPPGRERSAYSRQFYAECGRVLSDVKSKEPRWDLEFTQEQINSFLDEDFVTSGLAEKLLPEGISEPRIALEPGKVRLAFRYGNKPWSTVIAIDLRVALTREPNVVKLELLSLKAGSLPMMAQSLLEKVSEVARRNDIEVTWYRHQGNPVALLRFQPGRPRPTVQLQGLELHAGKIRVTGGAGEQ